MKYPPRCKHGWMSSCLEGCEDAYKPDFDDVWEYLVRLSVSGEVVIPVITDGWLPAMDQAVDEIRQYVPPFVDIAVEGVRKADPPSMKFFLRNVERDWSDDDRMIDEMVDEVLMDGLMEGLDDVSS